MGKHGIEYARVERDLYPTPSWVIGALAVHLELRGLTVWECACGDGRMAEALRLQGCARVYCTDIVERGAGQDQTFDFVSAQMPGLERPPDLICTNPPFGKGGSTLAESSRCCCRATLIPRRRAPATLAIARTSSARSC
jgi:predicted RNA methylase